MIDIVKRKLLLATLLAIGTVMTAPMGAVAQQRDCLSHGEINKLVKSKQILSFNKITRIMGLKKSTKVFGQRLCKTNGKFVYFFKIVDAKGNALGAAVNANNGNALSANN